MTDRLFVGIYPAGIVYADRHVQKSGDYARLAFLPYDTLQLQIEANCPAELRVQIEHDVAEMQARRGQRFQISTAGQCVILGAKVLNG